MEGELEAPLPYVSRLRTEGIIKQIRYPLDDTSIDV